jgi:hypothetical protein
VLVTGAKRAGDAEPGQPLAHHQLVLGQPQRGAARPDLDPRLLKRGQVIAGHLLVIEGQHVAAGRERAQVGQGTVIPHLGPGADLRGAVVGRIGQYGEADAEADGGLRGHPGQLAGAHHAHHGSARGQRTPRNWPARSRQVGGIGHAPYPT